MKTILLLRHGKSDQGADYEGDHNRPLSEHGYTQSRKIGRFLADTNQVPDVVLVSTAVRTRHTAETVMQAGGWAAEMKAMRSLYLPEPKDVLSALHGVSDGAGIVLIVCHQPATGAVIGGLIGGASVEVPTAALARIDCPVPQWSEVKAGTGRLVMLMPPKWLPA